jgi:hypothetical protein
MSEENQVIDPEVFEAQLLAEAQRKASDPAEQAAQIFKAYKKGFETSIDNMTKQGLQRLIKALVMSPLEDTPLPHQKEQEAFFYGNSMLEAKFIMQLHTINENTEHILEEYEKMKGSIKSDFLYGDEAKNDNL